MVANTFQSELPDRAYLPLRKVVAVGIGNALEFYDFLTFSFFAIQIGHSFFPQTGTSHGLLYSLATFGVGFITRPLGGVVIGRYGDRAGRKPAMILSFALMGFAILGIALIPPYTRIGIAAPILLVIFRLLQGFALGGEVGPSTAFLIEAAPIGRRGLYVALQYATQDAAILAAGIVGFVLSSWLSPTALDDWGWRAAFLIGLAIVPMGLALRRSLPETLHATEPPSESKAGRVPTGLVVRGLLLLGASTIATYVMNYMTSYAQDSLKLTADLAFGATIVSGLCFTVTDPFSGILSDRFGRKPVMFGALVLLALVAVPAFLAMNRLHSIAVVYAATAVLSILQALLGGPILVAVTESLPMAVRSGALATLYAVAIALFGGTTQFTIKWLMDATGSPLAPAWYLTGALAVGGIAMATMNETAPLKRVRLRASRPAVTR